MKKLIVMMTLLPLLIGPTVTKAAFEGQLDKISGLIQELGYRCFECESIKHIKAVHEGEVFQVMCKEKLKRINLRNSWTIWKYRMVVRPNGKIQIQPW